MAKNNLFLGSARGSVGDVTMYVRNGAQVSRLRRRDISNPRSGSQSLQRSLFAPVAKFYAPLSVALEKSFEGKNKSESYTAFLKENLRVAKAGNYRLPKDYGFFPLPFMLSKGTIQPVQYTFGGAGTEALLIDNTDDILQDGVGTVGDVSKVFKALGYLEGDQVTVIAVKSPLAGDDLSGDYFPSYARFNIAEDSTVDLDDVFSGFNFDYSTVDGLSVLSTDSYHLHAAAVIVSRYENGVWRRSTQFLACNDAIMEFAQSFENQEISKRSYMGSSSTPVSDVYLDGAVSDQAQLSDGLAVQLRNLGYSDSPAAAIVTYLAGSSYGQVRVKIGSDWLLTSSTKGTWPGTDPAPTVYLDGNSVQAWLQSKGVAASLF